MNIKIRITQRLGLEFSGFRISWLDRSKVSRENIRLILIMMRSEVRFPNSWVQFRIYFRWRENKHSLAGIS